MQIHWELQLNISTAFDTSHFKGKQVFSFNDVMFMWCYVMFKDCVSKSIIFLKTQSKILSDWLLLFLCSKRKMSVSTKNVK